MSALPVTLLTAEEYLTQERRAEYKSEFFQGEIFAMAGASRAHNVLVSRLLGEMYAHVKSNRKPCMVYPSDMRLHIPENSLYTYPDLMVVCGKEYFLDSESDTLLNPVLIVEVLSKSTEAYDRGDKFRLYRSIDSLQEYLLVDTKKISAEVHRKNAEGFWLLASESQSLAEPVHLQTIDLQLNMADVYDGVEFG